MKQTTTDLSDLFLEFPDSDLFRKYEIYIEFLKICRYDIAAAMREIIKEEVRECKEYKAWWKEILKAENFSDFSSSSSFNP